uniref:Mitochondrial import inner membrane translocase subunit n=1 Tax=Anopheles stephensi TaxID=30069 RepID=A0A182XVB6_ANOST
ITQPKTTNGVSHIYPYLPNWDSFSQTHLSLHPTTGLCSSLITPPTQPIMDVSLENLSSSQKDELMSTIKQKIAIANAQELVTKMTEKCFKKCVGKPGQDLDGSEQKCIAMCMDRFMDSWNVVSRALTQRLQQEQYKG